VRLAAVLIGALASAAPARAQDDHAPTRDQVSVQDRPGFYDAVNRIAKGDARAGTQLLDDLARRFGNDPDVFIVHYNLACAHAREKELEPAFAELARSIELGYGTDPRQLENLRRDPDLEPLRADPRFEKLRDEAKRRCDEVARTLPEQLAPFTWVPPPAADGRAAPHPLLIVLHPYGGERESFARANYLEFCRRHDFALLAPSGEFLLAPGRLCWFRGEGDFLTHFRLASRRVWAALEKLRKVASIDPQRIYVAGTGQGAALGFALALRNPQWVRGAVLYGGGYAPAALDDWEQSAARYARRIALVHGKDDEIYPVAPLGPFVAGLQKRGLALELTVIDAAHEMPGASVLEPLLLERLAWIDGAPFEPAAPAGGR
jgi:predicted esterase